MTGLEYTPPAGIPRTDHDWNGFENRTDSTISFNDGTLTLTIAPNVVSSYDYWAEARKYTSTGDTVVISDTDGVHLIYYNGATLTAQANPTADETATIIKTGCLVSAVYWNSTAAEAVYFGEERHGYLFPAEVHSYEHFENGLVYRSGLGLADFTIDVGNANVDAQFSVASGVVADEDIVDSISAVAVGTGLPIYYLTGASGVWNKYTNAGFSVRTFDGTSSTRLAWNQWTGAAWQLTEVGNTNFVLCHVFASTEHDLPMIAFMGQAEYTTLARARAGAETEVLSLITDNRLAPELRPIGTVIFQTGTTYSNDVKGKVVEVESGVNYVDWREENISRSTVTTSDHNSTSGKQGGAAGEFYHMTSAQHTAVTDEGGVDNADAQHEHAHNSTTGLNDGDYVHLTEARSNTLTNADSTIENADLQHNHAHNATTSIQGGSAGQYLHMTSTEYSKLTFSNSLVEDADAYHTHDGKAEVVHDHDNFSEDTDGFTPGPTSAEIAADKVLQADGTWVDQSGGSGEANTGSDLGGTAGTFKQKTGVDLEFRGISDGGNSDISVTENATYIGISVVPANIDHNDLGGKDVGDYQHLTQAEHDANVTTSTASIDNYLARYDGVTGLIIQAAGAYITDTFDLVVLGAAYISNGNLTVAAGNINLTGAGSTVDGVDLTAHVASTDSHHAQSHALTTHTDIATNTIVGRDTAGTGAPEILAPAQVRGILVETYTTLTYGASITPDVLSGTSYRFKFKLTLTGDATINLPTDIAEGMMVEFRVTQDGTGGHTITWAAADYNVGDITTIVDETASAVSYVLTKYNEVSGDMDIVAINTGY